MKFFGTSATKLLPRNLRPIGDHLDILTIVDSKQFR